MIYQDKKKTYFTDSLGRDFTHYGFKFKRPAYQVFRRLQCLDSKLSCDFWMQIGKRIKIGRHYGLLYMGLQVQRRVHLRLHQGKTINSENNTRRFGNVEQFTSSVRSVQSSMVDTYENGNFNQRNSCARNKMMIDWTWKWMLNKAIRSTIRMVEQVSITCIVS